MLKTKTGGLLGVGDLHAIPSHLGVNMTRACCKKSGMSSLDGVEKMSLSAFSSRRFPPLPPLPASLICRSTSTGYVAGHETLTSYIIRLQVRELIHARLSGGKCLTEMRNSNEHAYQVSTIASACHASAKIRSDTRLHRPACRGIRFCSQQLQTW